MNAAEHISQEDLALFALQMLSEEEAASVLAHVRQCDLCRKQVAEFQGDLAILALSAELQTPPAAAQERLMRRIAEEPRSIEAAKLSAASQAGALPFTDSEKTGAGRVLTMPSPGERPRSRFVDYLGWAVAAVCALAAGLQYQQRQQLKDQFARAQSQLADVQNNAATSQAAMAALTDPGALNVTLRQPAAKATGSAPEGRAAYLPDRGALVFVASNMEPLKPYKVYELWLLPAKAGMPPIAAASFKPDAAGNATVILPAGPKLVDVKGFGVTQEDDKSSLKQPTLPILLVGTSKS